jgi:methylmalonyl-CoA carboxyltransferase large subunit
MSKEIELTDLVKSLNERIKDLEIQVKSLKSKTDDIPEDVMVAISAAVSAYLGYEGEARQPHFNAHPAGRVAPSAKR